MSLNWKEIDCILNELSLDGTFIQNIIQPDYSSLILYIYRPGENKTGRYNRFPLLISFYPGAVRLHALSGKPERKIKLQRFHQLLRSRIKGCRILRAAQIHGQRIISLELSQGGDSGGRTILWVRLWGNAANALLCDAETSVIIDAFYRRPGKGELSGGCFLPVMKDFPDPDPRLTCRPLVSGLDLNTTVEKNYTEKENSERFNKKKNEMLKNWQRFLISQEAILKRLSAAGSLEQESTGYKHIGDLIMTYAHTLKEGCEWADVDDYNTGTRLRIRLDPLLSINENAARYYRKHKKEERRREHAARELSDQESTVAAYREIVAQVESSRTIAEFDNLPSIPVSVSLKVRAGKNEKNDKSSEQKGLFLVSGEWQIIVGRNAAESDKLLRSWARGNDYWIHTRDYPGGHIFLRGPKGKSPTLDVLLNGGNLAVYYSKARRNGGADCYYTRVKYLRRPKDGKTGTVLPTQEKNLDVKLDHERLSRVLNREITDDVT